MAKVYTTSTASINVPVVLTFVCPKCGMAGTVNKKAILSAQATVRGYNSSAAGMFAQQNLASTAGNQINGLVESLKKGNLASLVPDDNKMANKGLTCPHCHLKQVVEAEGKRKVLRTGGYVGLITGLCFAAITVPILFAALSAANNGQANYPAFLPVVLFLACVAAIVAAIVYNRSQSKKAYSDPALMEKRYQSVLNPQIQATLMPGLGNMITVDVPERRSSVG